MGKEKTAEAEKKTVLTSQLERTMQEKEKALQALASSEQINVALLEALNGALTEKERKQLIHDQLSSKEREFVQ
jgi:hypothetical protein